MSDNEEIPQEEVAQEEVAAEADAPAAAPKGAMSIEDALQEVRWNKQPSSLATLLELFS